MLKRAGRDISNAKRRLRSPRACLTSLNRRLIRTTRMVRRIVGGKDLVFGTEEPMKQMFFEKTSMNNSVQSPD